jgi:hypothetical protein
MNGQHGFTRVDEEPRPDAWVECLDKLQREPFYQQYKQRVREILSPRTTGLSTSPFGLHCLMVAGPTERSSTSRIRNGRSAS